jgi:hypothetical protein
MLTCLPTRSLASTGGHHANASPWLERANYNLDARSTLLIHTGDASLNKPLGLTTIPFRAHSAASAYLQHLSIPILLPR